MWHKPPDPAQSAAPLDTDFSVRLEAANSAVEETRRLRIQLAAQFAETFQRQDFLGINVHTMGFSSAARASALAGSNPIWTL